MSCGPSYDIDVHLVGRSRPMTALKQLIRQIAPVDLPVLIEGETGTGKELVAQALHALGSRVGPLVAVNVSEYPGDLLECALFGSARGAFTGSIRSENGLLASASGGTLFLDEVECMSESSQVRLLRALESREWRRLGESTLRRGTFRLVSASNVPVDSLVRAGKLRLDFAYRLRGMRVAVPPLRARSSDIGRLAQLFIGRAGSCGASGPRLDLAAVRLLRTRHWSGNVRELRYVAESAAALAGGGIVTLSHVQAALELHGEPLWDSPVQSSLHEALERAEGCALTAARLLGISRATLYRRARAVGVRVAHYRVSPLPW